MQIRVYYEDTDAGGVVYHANYLKFCERARSEILYAKGETLSIEGAQFVVKSLQANYHASAKLGDILDITTRVVAVNGASVDFEQNVYRQNTLLFILNVRVVLVNQQGRIVRISERIAQIFT
ncbi:MAG: hypothetical protein KU37_10100 [Sulfuricurvum sp. PC08-66]|nr:MAG: hypothetical protein KU37_10100 [Sulfuricurvum sp. PC08-66]